MCEVLEGMVAAVHPGRHGGLGEKPLSGAVLGEKGCWIEGNATRADQDHEMEVPIGERFEVLAESLVGREPKHPLRGL